MLISKKITVIKFFHKNVEKTIRQWPHKLRAKLIRIFDLMQQYGPDLGMPITRALGNGLFEIRVNTNNHSGRIFFCYMIKKEVMVLHVFIKKTQETPMKELKLAKKRYLEVKTYEIQTNSL